MTRLKEEGAVRLGPAQSLFSHSPSARELQGGRGGAGVAWRLCPWAEPQEDTQVGAAG